MVRSPRALSRLSVDSLWLLLARIGTQLGLALFTILLARGLGSAAFGEYAFMASIVFIGNVVTTFGTDMLLIREIAATDDIAGLASALWVQLLLSAVFIGGVFLISSMLPSRTLGDLSALRIYSLSLLPLAFYTVFTTALRGRQRMRAYAALNVAVIVMQISAAAWLLWRGGQLTELAILLVLIQLCAAVLACLICALQFRDLADLRLLMPMDLAPVLKAAAPIALLGVLGVMYQRLTILLLPALAGSSATGWYSAAARVVEAAKIGHVAVFTALYPMMAQQRGVGKERWSRQFRMPGLVLFGGALLASVALGLLAAILIFLLYGTEYLASIPVVRILAWTLVPYALNSFLSLAFLAKGEEGAVVKALAISTLVLTVLTVWWAEAAGGTGAAWAALCAEVTQAAILLSVDIRRVRVLAGMIGRAGKEDKKLRIGDAGL